MYNMNDLTSMTCKIIMTFMTFRIYTTFIIVGNALALDMHDIYDFYDILDPLDS